MSIIMFIIFITIFIFAIFFFPGFDEDFFLVGTQIYGNSTLKSIIELFDIVSCDISFSMCCQMSFYDIRESIYQDIKWFSLIGLMSFFSFRSLLECLDDESSITRTRKREFFLSNKLDDNIWHSKKTSNPWWSSHFDSLDFCVWDIEKIWGKPPPPHIDDCTFCHDPYASIPVKKLIHQYSIYRKHIESVIKSGYTFSNREYVVIIQKTRYTYSKKYPEEYLLNNHKKMPVKYMLYRLIRADISWKK